MPKYPTDEIAELEDARHILKERDARIAALVEVVKELLPYAIHAEMCDEEWTEDSGVLPRIKLQAMICRAEKLIAENTVPKG